MMLNILFVCLGVIMLAFGALLVHLTIEIIGAPCVVIGIVLIGAGILDAICEYIRSKGVRL